MCPKIVCIFWIIVSLLHLICSMAPSWVFRPRDRSHGPWRGEHDPKLNPFCPIIRILCKGACSYMRNRDVQQPWLGHPVSPHEGKRLHMFFRGRMHLQARNGMGESGHACPHNTFSHLNIAAPQPMALPDSDKGVHGSSVPSVSVPLWPTWEETAFPNGPVAKAGWSGNGDCRGWPEMEWYTRNRIRIDKKIGWHSPMPHLLFSETLGLIFLMGEGACASGVVAGVGPYPKQVRLVQWPSWTVAAMCFPYCQP